MEGRTLSECESGSFVIIDGHRMLTIGPPIIHSGLHSETAVISNDDGKINMRMFTSALDVKLDAGATRWLLGILGRVFETQQIPEGADGWVYNPEMKAHLIPDTPYIIEDGELSLYIGLFPGEGPDKWRKIIKLINVDRKEATQKEQDNG